MCFKYSDYPIKRGLKKEKRERRKENGGGDRKADKMKKEKARESWETT